MTSSSNEPEETHHLPIQHLSNPSLSSLGSDVNLFSYEENSANTSSVSIPASIESEQNTPVMVKRTAKFAGMYEEHPIPLSSEYD